MSIQNIKQFIDRVTLLTDDTIPSFSPSLNILAERCDRAGDRHIIGQDNCQDLCSVLAESSDRRALFEIDVRTAFDPQIFRQNTIDYGWVGKFNLDRERRVTKTKIVVYVCGDEIPLTDAKISTDGYAYICERLPDRYIIGCYWQAVYHIYVRGDVDLFPANKDEVAERSSGCYHPNLEDLPLVSIVTVVFNGEDFIEQTIQSVISQSYPKIQYIIIDGGSSDRTLEIVDRYDDAIDICISEKDEGIYDAMNKGFRLAKGTYINFMNVGDCFYNFRAIENLQLSNSLDSVCGANLYFGNTMERFLCSQLDGYNLPHQALFMNEAAFSHHSFDTSYKYSGDAELWTRVIPDRAIVSSDTIVSLSRFGGVSSSSKYLIPRMKEHLRYEHNKLAVYLRFIPKIIVSLFINDRILEKWYFFLNGKPFACLPQGTQVEP